MITHEFAPVYNEESQILIVGTFPSVKSRETGFYYGHPQNRFWKVIAGIYQEEVPVSIEEKQDILWRNKIAIWDVIQSCDIVGSSDMSIKNVIPNDLATIIAKSKITRIYTNGKTAGKLYQKYMQGTITLPMWELPSTSPANAAYTLDKLKESWKIIKENELL